MQIPAKRPASRFSACFIEDLTSTSSSFIDVGPVHYALKRVGDAVVWEAARPTGHIWHCPPIASVRVVDKMLPRVLWELARQTLRVHKISEDSLPLNDGVSRQYPTVLAPASRHGPKIRGWHRTLYCMPEGQFLLLPAPEEFGRITTFYDNPRVSVSVWGLPSGLLITKTARSHQYLVGCRSKPMPIKA